MGYDNDHDISKLNGRTITAVHGIEVGNDEVRIECADGSVWRMVHYQDCCESVNVEDVCGDASDLIGTVIDARMETNAEVHPEGKVFEYEPDSFTWTFYIIQTDKGAVTIRWLGESNGYYSEGVDFECLNPGTGATS